MPASAAMDYSPPPAAGAGQGMAVMPAAAAVGGGAMAGAPPPAGGSLHMVGSGGAWPGNVMVFQPQGQGQGHFPSLRGAPAGARI